MVGPGPQGDQTLDRRESLGLGWPKVPGLGPSLGTPTGRRVLGFVDFVLGAGGTVVDDDQGFGLHLHVGKDQTLVGGGARPDLEGPAPQASPQNGPQLNEVATVPRTSNSDLVEFEGGGVVVGSVEPARHAGQILPLVLHLGRPNVGLSRIEVGEGNPHRVSFDSSLFVGRVVASGDGFGQGLVEAQGDFVAAGRELGGQEEGRTLVDEGLGGTGCENEPPEKYRSDVG